MGSDQSPNTNILLICREGKSSQVYQAALDIPGVSLVCVSSLADFFSQDVYCPLNGIMVDMPTYMRSSEEEKQLLAELVGLFPALRLKCHEPSGEIRTLPFGTAYPGPNTPAFFVQNYCAVFHQRTIRTCERSLQNLPALLTMTPPQEDGTSTRTATANVSQGGCFLITFEQWAVGDQGWLILPMLEDPTQIPVEVCWVRMWGECRSLPGIGIRFIDLTESQKAELGRLGGRSLIQGKACLPKFG